jgi:hypothetical protein
VIGLNPEAPPWRRYVVERVRVLILPPPVRVRLTLITEAGQPLDLEPLEARLELPGPAGPSTSWQEAVLAELTAACGIDPEGLDIRHLDRMLECKTVEAKVLEIDGGHALVGTRRPAYILHT